MAFALELRVPLLDHRLAEQAWALPDRFKLRGAEGKWLLRRAARGRVPAEILERPKQGFTTPTAAWLRGALLPLLRDALLGADALGRGRWSRRQLEGMIEEHRRGQADRTPELWALLVLELWHGQLRRHPTFRQPLDGGAAAAVR